MELLLCNQHVELLPEKAIFWKEESILVVSDLHLGKTATFRRAGIPVPDAVMLHDLENLILLLQRKRAKRCVIAGDFLHHPSGLTDQTLALIEDWLLKTPCPVDLILGNHDRAFKQIKHEHWKMTIYEKALFIKPFAFSHIHTDFPGFFTWSGHIHPQIIIGNRRKMTRLPCFLIQPEKGLLPAYSSFAGGFSINRDPNSEIYAIVDDSVIKI